MQQYYVGVDDNRVTIFQGVRGDVLGLPLHDIVEHSDLTINDLTESDLSAVTDGIVSTDGLDGAHNLVSRLNDRKLNPCPIISATSDPSRPPDAATATPLPPATVIPGVTCRAG